MGTHFELSDAVLYPLFNKHYGYFLFQRKRPDPFPPNAQLYDCLFHRLVNLTTTVWHKTSSNVNEYFAKDY